MAMDHANTFFDEIVMKPAREYIRYNQAWQRSGPTLKKSHSANGKESRLQSLRKIFLQALLIN